MFQALGAKNLVEGLGISFQHVSAADLSSVITEPVNRWPAGYSLLLAPFYWLTGNLDAACIIVDILSITFFFIVLSRVLHHLQIQPAISNTIILFAGSTFGPTLSKPTDLLACAALLYACLLLLIFVSDRLKSPAFCIAIGTAIVIPGAFRYMYAPCAVLIPVMLLWLGYKRKDKRMIRGGMYALSTAVVLLAVLTMIQSVLVGSSAYVMSSGKGFFPRNLLMTYPFIVDAFIDINFSLQQAESLTGLSYILLFKCLQIINLLLLTGLAYAWINFLVRRHPALWKPFDHFLYITGAISGLLLLVLVYLSVTNNADPVPFRSSLRWTFVGDGRYYLFTALFLPVIGAYLLFNKPESGNRYWPLQLLFFTLVVFQLAHTLYFIGGRLEPLGLKGNNVLITHPVKSFLVNRINHAKQDGYNVALTGIDETVSNWATLNGASGILHVQELFSADVNPQKPTIVFVLIEKKMLPSFQDNLANKNFRIEKELFGLTIFSKSYLP